MTQLHGTEPDFQTLFEVIPGLYLVLQPDLTIVAASNAYLEATMTQRQDILGRGLFEVFPDNPNDPAATGAQNLRASLTRVLKEGRSDAMAVQKYDIQRPESEGGGFEERYWSPINAPVFNANQEIQYIIHKVEDVTEFIQLKKRDVENNALTQELRQELRAKTEEMESEVFHRAQQLQEVNQQLRDANEKLSELDRAKTDFFSNVSHEFRTPLTLILGPIEEAISNPEKALKGATLEAVYRNALRLLRLVNNVLDFTRIEAGYHQARVEPTDLATLTAGVGSAFRSLIESAGITFSMDCPPLPEPVYVDRSCWEKIVLNLLSNAFKFTFEGEIAVSLTWCGDHIELAVRDTGVGISERNTHHIFERFHRIPNTRGRSIEGTGIGLALVQELVKLHGGDISVTSIEKQGSTFAVSIPTGTAHLSAMAIHVEQQLNDVLTDSTHTEPPKTTLLSSYILGETSQWFASREKSRNLSNEEALDNANDEPQDARGYILVVDDNLDMREYLCGILSTYWNVKAVENGEVALASIAQRLPDLILSDVMMPLLDGFELLREVRTSPRTSSIPFVLLSARAGEEAIFCGLGTGADDYLVKPFTTQELLARVHTHLTMARVRIALQKELMATNQRLQETHVQLLEAEKMASIYRVSTDLINSCIKP
ncbi:MAG: ATP-binding protein [Pseudomonadota bacterium]